MKRPIDKELQSFDDIQKDNRGGEYAEANDRLTQMTDMEMLIHRLEGKGYNDQFRVENKKLVSMKSKKKYKPKDVTAVNFFRFEGISDPDDMSVLYAIETTDGCKGTLADAYGLYADEQTGEFMKEVETHKKVTEGKIEE